MKAVRSGLVIAIAMGLVVTVANAALAQRFVPKNRGLPGRREGSGTRGACVQARRSVVAMMPTTNSGLTVSAHPTFSWAVPTTQPTKASFVLLDDQQNEVYSTSFYTTGQAGLVSLSLPQDANLRPLQVGKLYRWKFSLTCDVDDPSSDMVTEGWLQRVELVQPLRQQVQSASKLEQAAIYAREGIWYDAASTLLLLRRTQPNDPKVAMSWKALLNSVALDDLAQMH